MVYNIRYYIIQVNLIWGGDIIKKKVFNNIMFIISLIYLIISIILIVFKKIDFNLLNLFNTDGLALLGCIFATGELFFSKRNKISKKINEFLIKRKHVNFRIDISARCLKSEISIKDISNKFEEVLIRNLLVKDLERKPESKLTEDRWSLKYGSIGLELEYLKQNNSLFIILKGKTQYGKINIKDNDILYLSLLIKLLGNEFLQDKHIRKLIEVNKIDIIIKQNGSQFKLNNIFNEELIEVKDYSIKITKDLGIQAEIFINSYQIKLSVLTEGALFDGFMELTNIICNVN